MPKIRNKRYLEFLETGTINPMLVTEFSELLAKVRGQTPDRLAQGRALAIIIYYSGRRPVEILKLTPKDLTKEKRNLAIRFPTAKGGKTSLIYIPFNEHIKEFWDYAIKGLPNVPIFYLFLTDKKKAVSWETKDGGPRVRVYPESNAKVKQLFRQYFGVPAYFFRHNRYSLMAERGAPDRAIKHAKGGGSIEYYIHLSRAQAKKNAKYYK